MVSLDLFQVHVSFDHVQQVKTLWPFKKSIVLLEEIIDILMNENNSRLVWCWLRVYPKCWLLVVSPLGADSKQGLGADS